MSRYQFPPQVRKQYENLSLSQLYKIAKPGKVNVSDKPNKIRCINRLQCSRHGALYGAIGGLAIGGVYGLSSLYRLSQLEQQEGSDKENVTLKKQQYKIMSTVLALIGAGSAAGAIGGSVLGP